jgi:hypothetical protein
VRTTVTIDPDTENLLQAEMRRTGASFKEVLNQSIRRALISKNSSDTIELTPLFIAPFPQEFSHTNFNRLADEIDDADTLRELGA